MATTANSSSWVRTYTKDDATKYQIAYRSNNTWRLDAKGKAVPGSFTTNLQVDRTAIDGGVTGGNASTTEKVRITSDGNVGIGITNPTQTMVLKDTDPVIHLIRNFASGTSDIGRINFGNSNWDSSLVSIAAVGDGANDAGALLFETQATGNITCLLYTSPSPRDS